LRLAFFAAGFFFATAFFRGAAVFLAPALPLAVALPFALAFGAFLFSALVFFGRAAFPDTFLRAGLGAATAAVA
jgi:hypothetical protein